VQLRHCYDKYCFGAVLLHSSSVFQWSNAEANGPPSRPKSRVSYYQPLLKAGFHMIATITAIAGQNVQQSLRSCENHFLAFVAITTIIWKPVYMETAQRSKSQRPLNFFGSDRSDRSDDMETSLKPSCSSLA